MTQHRTRFVSGQPTMPLRRPVAPLEAAPVDCPTICDDTAVHVVRQSEGVSVRMDEQYLSARNDPPVGHEEGPAHLSPLRKVVGEHWREVGKNKLGETLSEKLLRQMQEDAAAYAETRRSLGLPWETAVLRSDNYDIRTLGGLALVHVGAREKEVPVSTLWLYDPSNKPDSKEERVGRILFGSVVADTLSPPASPLEPSIREQLTFRSFTSGTVSSRRERRIAKESKLAVTPSGDLVVVGMDLKSPFEERSGQTGRAGAIDATQQLQPSDLFITQNLTQRRAKHLRSNWIEALARQLETDTRALREGKSRGKPLAEFSNEIEEKKLLMMHATRGLKRRLAGAALTVALSVGGTAAGHYDVLQVRERIGTLFSQDEGAHSGNAAQAHYDAMESTCYYSEQSSGDGISMEGQVMQVTEDKPTVSYMSADARVEVYPGVHVEELLVCGASASAYVDKGASVGEVGVFGAGAEIDIKGYAGKVVYLNENGQATQASDISNAAVTRGGQLLSWQR